MLQHTLVAIATCCAPPLHDSTGTPKARQGGLPHPPVHSGKLNAAYYDLALVCFFCVSSLELLRRGGFDHGKQSYTHRPHSSIEATMDCAGALQRVSSEAKIQMVQQGKLQQLRTSILDELSDGISNSLLSTYLLALVLGDKALVQALREHGHVNLDVGFSIISPLQQVARSGSFWAVGELLSDGAEFSGPGNTPDAADVEWAAEGGSVEMLKDFVENRGMQSCQASRSCSVLASACRSGSVECVKYILRRGLYVAPGRRDRQTLLRCLSNACRFGGLRMVKALIKHGFPADVNALSAAVSSGDLSIVRYFLEKGVDVNGICGHCDHTPLMSLLICPPEEGLVDTLDLLLEHGAVPHAVPGSGTPPLELAWSAPLAAVQKLLDAGAPVRGVVGGQANAPLCAFAQRKRCDAIRLLLEHGADVNEQDKYKYTPFLWAAIQGDSPSMRLLLWRGASLDAVSERGDSFEQLLDRKPALVAEVHHWRDSLRWRQLPLLHRVATKQACAVVASKSATGMRHGT